MGCLLLTSVAVANPGYFRSPDLHNDTLVFTAEGDLWLANINSGQSQRLTTHLAEEKEAAFSPDGEWVAFSANYEGANEVYVIPANGGVAKRVSFENSAALVQGWTPEGEVLYTSLGQPGIPGNRVLRAVDPATLATRTLPLTDAAEGAFDASGDALYFVRFGLQYSTDNVRAYRGGAQGTLWRHAVSSGQEAEPLLSDHEGSIREPMVKGDQVFFISDASGTDNLWSFDVGSGETKQLTTFTRYEVRQAKRDGDRIVFQHGADIKTLSLVDGDVDVMNIKLTSDFPHLRERWEPKPLKYLNATALPAKDKKLVITARGRVAIATTDASRLVELNTPPEHRLRSAVLSQDGEWVYAISDQSGEHEIWRFAADGSKQAKPLTDDGTVYRWHLHLSPDGEHIAHDDNEGRLYLLNLKSGQNRLILEDDNGLGPYASVAWSSDSRYLAITRNHKEDNRSRILLYGLDEGKSQVLTSNKYESFDPTFSADGQWLYFLSNRHFKASPGNPWGDRNTGSSFDRRTEIYAFDLSGQGQFPFQTPNELNKAEDKKEEKDDKESGTEVVWKGLAERLWKVPVASGNYKKMAANDTHLFFSDRINEPNKKPQLMSLKMEHGSQPKPFTDNLADFQLSQDGKNLFVRKAGGDNANMFIVPAGDAFPKDLKTHKVQAQSWQLLIDPKAEWQQLFHDTWLMHRDQFFDRSMRGLDWPAIKAKYQPLFDRITDRYELNDVFGQMIGELNVLHSQVRGGDVPKAANSPKAATLGASLASGKKGVLINEIYRNDPELPHMGSPLAMPGVDAQNGDLITAINGQSVNSLADVHRLLRNQVKQQVLLTVKRGQKSHQTVVVPLSTADDRRLRYQHWVQGRKQWLETQNSDVGYLHIQAMGSNDFANFTREFYAQVDKPALIIDVRRNRGGNIDSLILEKLLRRNWSFWQTTRGKQWGNMQQTFAGHLVVLADQFTYSDGETFTAGIKAMNLGTVIGKQTAGAGVWLRGNNRVSDNGISRVAEFPVYDLDGNWVVEGRGVSPDIEVDNLPHATFNGHDAQLEAALELLKKKMKDEPIQPRQIKDFPPVDVPAKDVTGSSN